VSDLLLYNIQFGSQIGSLILETSALLRQRIIRLLASKGCAKVDRLGGKGGNHIEKALKSSSFTNRVWNEFENLPRLPSLKRPCVPEARKPYFSPRTGLDQ
jgi:hypothetical protein